MLRMLNNHCFHTISIIIEFFCIILRSVQQKCVTIEQRKTTTIRRSLRTKLSSTATPLRQVMSKSIQRAILEHASNSPKSPLDLRMSPVIRRTDFDKISSPKRHSMKYQRDENTTPERSAVKRRSIEMKTSSMLETVYESARSTIDDVREGNNVNIEAVIIETTEAKQSKNTINNSIEQKVSFETTPIFIGNVGSAITNDNDDDACVNSETDIWYTPSEAMPTMGMEKPSEV